jgi:peptidoglycan/LPS O-acetylase OafA/YrhL
VSSIVTTSEAVVAIKQSARLRLDYLDGVRALAALYVAMTHAYNQVNAHGDGGGLSPAVLHVTGWLDSGRYAVDVFIVLSGFCLMLPVVTSGEGRLRGSILNYLKRRARRILPPYYASLILTLLIIALVPGMGQPSGARWDMALPAFTPVVLASHFLLFHNLHPDWAYKINGAMWSVATEWQIYFLFPVLLALWRRLGIVAAVITGFTLGMAVFYISPTTGYAAIPWYLGLFALGMAGVVFSFARSGWQKAWRERFPWGAAAFALAVCIVVLTALHKLQSRPYAMDALVGIAGVCFLVHCARLLTADKPMRPSLALRLVNARATVFLGAFSYSIYLAHVPVLALMNLGVRGFGLSPEAQLALFMLLGVPVAVGCAYLFHLAFERRFMPGHLRKN